MLHYNVQEVKRIVAAPAGAVARFAEEQSPEQQDPIYDDHSAGVQGSCILQAALHSTGPDMKTSLHSGPYLQLTAQQQSSIKHAVWLCRLLHFNVQEAKRIVAAPAGAIARFAEEQSPEQRDRIFDELNTLAVVYRQPSSSFTTTVPAHKEVKLLAPHLFCCSCVCHCCTQK